MQRKSHIERTIEKGEETGMLFLQYYFCICMAPAGYFGTSVGTQTVTAGVHGVSSKKCQLEAVE